MLLLRLLLTLRVLHLWWEDLICLLRLVLCSVVLVLSNLLLLLLFSRFFLLLCSTDFSNALLKVHSWERVWLEHLVRRLVDGVAQTLVRTHL